MIEIGLCADEGYAMPCGVCITSIFESNKENKIRVHILTDGFSDESIKRLNRTAERYNQTIEIHKIDASLFKDLPTRGHFTLMVYARLLFPQVLDSKIDKLLYLDCDITVVKDIKELWDTDITEYACGCVPGMYANDIRVHNRLEVYDFTYVNSGVILMNLNRWREDNIGNRCIEFALNNPEKCPYVDQDAINAVLHNEIKLLSFRYNLPPSLSSGKQKERWMIHKKYWPEIDNARQNLVIIHYPSRVKPWHKELKFRSDETTARYYFLETLKISEWSDYKLRYKHKGLRLILFYLRTRYLHKIQSIFTKYVK